MLELRPTPATDTVARRHRASRRRPTPLGRLAWVALAVALLLVAVTFVIATKMRPGYDAYGWLVWGRQTLHGNLNTDGAPSWKPLTFLFTLPYSLVGTAAVWLWMATAVAAGFSGCVFAARIAYRLTGPAPERGWAPIAAAVFAGLGILTLGGYFPLVLIANSDPMIIALCLAAIDCHLCGRHRLAFAAVLLAALGRPEAWLFALLYALWAWRGQRGMRWLVTIGIALIPILWFSVPALTSKSWLSPGDLALNSMRVIHGSKITGVFTRFLDLNQLPIKLAAAVALVLAIARRDRASLLVAAAALLWVVVEIAFALHGWSAAPRYLAEPAAVVVVLAGSALGRLLILAPPAPRIVGWIGVAAAVALVVSVVPVANTQVQDLRTELTPISPDTTKIKRLAAVIDRIGGPTAILACGTPVSLVGYQSIVAYYTHLNVGNVGYKPGRAIDSGKPIVFFKPHLLGWEVRPDHMLPSDQARCNRLATDTDFN